MNQIKDKSGTVLRGLSGVALLLVPVLAVWFLGWGTLALSLGQEVRLDAKAFAPVSASRSTPAVKASDEADLPTVQLSVWEYTAQRISLSQ